MSYRAFEEEVVARPGAAERIAELEQRILTAHALRMAREKAGITQKKLAERMGISQPRIAAIERASDISLTTLVRYISALGGEPKIEILLEGVRIPLVEATAYDVAG